MDKAGSGRMGPLRRAYDHAQDKQKVAVVNAALHLDLYPEAFDQIFAFRLPEAPGPGTTARLK